MRLPQPIHPSVAYSIEIPPDWIVIVDTSTGLLRASLRGGLSLSEMKSVVEVTDVDFGLTSFALVGATLEEYAEAQMKHHVRQGEPERFADEIDGCSALGYEWTDGVQDIATWFIEPLASIVVRIDHGVPYLGPRARGIRSREEAASLLAGLEWSVRS